MAGPNSWTLPGNGILGGVTFGTGTPRPDDPNSEYEMPWAQALREAIERQSGGDVDRLSMLAEQVRGGAITEGPHEALARAGQPIIQHYLDYFDPLKKNAEGRYVVETPEAWIPNKVGKLAESRNPWFMPIVGGIDLASNFVTGGAAAGTKVISALPKAVVAEASPISKLLGAIRGGGLAKFAGEAGGTESLASRSARLYNPPAKTPRPFAADYPAGAKTDAEGRLLTDIEGRPLIARYIAGRRDAGVSDVRIAAQDLPEIAQGSIGAIPEAVEARALPRGAVGAYRVKPGPDGPERSIGYLRSLPAAQTERVVAHEIGHMIDEMAGTIPTDGLSRELAQVYNTLNTGQERTRHLTRPQRLGYRGDDVPREFMAEAIRAYMADPNHLKTVAPKTAARIREFVNANPKLSKIIQFNTVAGAVPFMQGSQREAGDIADAP